MGGRDIAGKVWSIWWEGHSREGVVNSVGGT